MLLGSKLLDVAVNSNLNKASDCAQPDQHFHAIRPRRATPRKPTLSNRDAAIHTSSNHDSIPMSDIPTPPEQASEPAGDAAGTQVVPMVLISQEQRNALIDYLAKMPYQDVAAGISFLREAPVVNVNITSREATDGDS